MLKISGCLGEYFQFPLGYQNLSSYIFLAYDIHIFVHKSAKDVKKTELSMVRLGLATPGLQKTEFLHNFQSLRSTLNLFPPNFLATPYSRKTWEGVLDSPPGMGRVKNLHNLFRKRNGISISYLELNFQRTRGKK